MTLQELLKHINDNAEIIAILLAPIVTWYITILYQNRKEKRQAKINLFFTLMAHRKKSPPAIAFVDALNMIDVVFQRNRKVRLAWKEYLDSLHPNSQHFANNHAFLLDLLSEMALVLGYNKGLKQTEIDRTYSPQYYDDSFVNQTIINQELLRVLKHSKNLAEGFPDSDAKEQIQEVNKKKKKD